MNTRTHKNNGQPYGCRSLDFTLVGKPPVPHEFIYRAIDGRGFAFT